MSVEDGIPETGQAPAAPQHDWEKDYKELQSTYTQSQQRLRELERYESDPNAYYELGAKHGVQFEFPQEQTQQQGAPDEYAQKLTAAEQRIAQLESRAQAEQAAAGEELFHQDLDTWAQADGVKLSKADHNAIFGLLMKAPDPTQEATARQIFDAHVADKKADVEAQRAAWEEERRRPRVPTPPAGGAAHTGAPNWREMSESDQAEYMAQRVLGQI